jgi:membrane protease YdiL (CAAX protease family)
MKVCDYCGKANEDAMLSCAGCGTALNATSDAPAKSSPKNQPQMLNARSATIIFLAYAAAQILGSFLFGVSSLAGLVLSFVFGGVTMILMALALIPKHLKDTSPTGAAWVLGSWETIAKGLAIGLIIGMGDEILPAVIKYHVAHKNLNPLHQMAFTPGLSQIIWVVMSIIIAPPLEEMLYRGIFYGGYRKSFGPVWAATLTSLLFIAIHLPYYIHLPPAIIGITAATLATLWCRLRWNAIGPAIAAHVGYNSVITFGVVYLTW